MTSLKAKPGFDWNKLTWSRPDSPQPAICSYCSGALPDVPLKMWSLPSFTVSFCDSCAATCFSLQTFEDLDEHDNVSKAEQGRVEE